MPLDDDSKLLGKIEEFIATPLESSEEASDRRSEQLVNSPLGREAAKLDPLGGMVAREHEAAEADLELVDREHQQMVDTIGKDLHNSAPASAAGVSTEALKAVDPQWDESAFLPIARETYLLLSKARSLEDVMDATDLLSDQLHAQLVDEIQQELRTRTMHIFPGLEIESATISGAAVVDGMEQVDVDFSLSGDVETLDDRIKGRHTEFANVKIHTWNERWRFVRDPKVDTSDLDERHILSNAAAWMVPHRGWKVTSTTEAPGAGASAQ